MPYGIVKYHEVLDKLGLKVPESRPITPPPLEIKITASNGDSIAIPFTPINVNQVKGYCTSHTRPTDITNAHPTTATTATTIGFPAGSTRGFIIVITAG